VKNDKTLGTRLSCLKIDDSPFLSKGIIRRRFFSSTEVAFFGHSLGAIMAVETALYLKKHHHLEPSHLFVSGASAPNSPAFKEYLKVNSTIKGMISETYNADS
jgi:surfactin synthase thioesterase subunit